jgi:hypothetical protein
MPDINHLCIIRHAEKPVGNDGGLDQDGNATPYGLTVRGWQRAGALAAAFAPNNTFLTSELPVPTALTAPSYPQPVHRPMLTLLPLSNRLAIPIQQPEPVDADPATIVGAVLALNAEAVVISWEHLHIPPLASAFAGHLAVTNANAIPASWPDDRFDLIWRFQQSADQSWTFGIVGQQLLARDSAMI